MGDGAGAKGEDGGDGDDSPSAMDYDGGPPCRDLETDEGSGGATRKNDGGFNDN